MAMRKTGSRVVTVEGVRYRWRRSSRLRSPYDFNTVNCAIELAENPGQLLVLETHHPEPATWGDVCYIPFGPKNVAFWIRRALAQGWVPSAKGRPFLIRDETICNPTLLPTAVVDLAAALSSGEDCSFALHDALQDAGLIELADHFASGHHPPDCLILRLLLAHRTAP